MTMTMTMALKQFFLSVFRKFSKCGSVAACFWAASQPLALCAQPAAAQISPPAQAQPAPVTTLPTNAPSALLGATAPVAPVAVLAPAPVAVLAAASAALPAAAPPATPPSQSAIVFDPKTELKGAVLVAALKLGGYVMYMRHAVSTVGSDGALDTTANWWDNCAIQRNIADSGRLQARKVGLALRTMGVPVTEIKTSQFCRARDTAHELGLGAIEITEDLNHLIGQRHGFDVNAARFAQLARKPAAGGNTLLVSHTHGSPKPEERAMSTIQEAEIVVYLSNDAGGTEPIGRLLVSDWDTLIPNLNNPVAPAQPSAPQVLTPQK